MRQDVSLPKDNHHFGILYFMVRIVAIRSYVCFCKGKTLWRGQKEDWTFPQTFTAAVFERTGEKDGAEEEGIWKVWKITGGIQPQRWEVIRPFRRWSVCEWSDALGTCSCYWPRRDQEMRLESSSCRMSQGSGPCLANTLEFSVCPFRKLTLGPVTAINQLDLSLSLVLLPIYLSNRWGCCG